MLLKFDEFNLSVRPLGDHRYLVRTEKTKPGVPVAEETFEWPLETWLEQTHHLMSNPMISLLQGNHGLEQKEPLGISTPSSPPTLQFSSDLTTLGQKLHDALFQGSIRDSWLIAQGIAYNHRAILRLRLGLGAEELLRLPWEVLHVGEKQGYGANFRPLATGTDVTFSRYQLNTPIRKPNFTSLHPPLKPLKILMAIASPNDQESLELKEEVEQLQEELEKQTTNGSGFIDLTVLEQPGREDLTQSLEQGQYQVFHYSGHSGLGDSGGTVNLVSRDTKLTEKLSGNDLAGLLVNNGVKLAIFNSCRSANVSSNSSEEQEQNLAQTLVNRGIPAVLAMAEQIPDEVALTLTRLLYRNLNQGCPIDLSLSRARQGLISAYGSDTLYWALPIIYQHPSFDGILTPPEALSTLPPQELVFPEGEAVNLPQDPYHSSLEESPVPEDDTEDFIKSVFSELATEESDELPVQTPAEPLSTEENGEETTPAPVVKVNWGMSQNRPLIKWILGGIGTLAVTIGGMIWVTSNPTPSRLQIDVNAPPIEIPIASSEQNQRQALDNNSLKISAIQNFLAGELEKGQLDLEELLAPDRNALNYAEVVFQGIDSNLLNRPQISFLRGRLAWQSIQVSADHDYLLGDVKRYWQTAVKEQPDSLTYLNALGFAYYQEQKWEKATQTWTNALHLGEIELFLNPDSPSYQESLNTYAGFAMGLRKLINTASEQQIPQLEKQYNKLCQMIVNGPLVEWQSETLSQNWLWTQEAIQDWQTTRTDCLARN